MTTEEFKKPETKDDYCDCDHAPRCPHCGKKMRPQSYLPQPYLPPERPGLPPYWYLGLVW